MVPILILISSFVVAVIGLIQSHAVGTGGSGVFGLTRLGATLVGIAILGFVFGIIKESQDRRQELERTRWLKEIHAKVVGEAEHAPPEEASRLREIGELIRRVATVSRESNFSMSDFVGANFAQGNFANASFREANTTMPSR